MQNAFIAQLLTEPAPAPIPDVAAVDMPAVELPASPEFEEENIEMHDSALFDVVVEVDFYDGTRLRIPQEVWPEGWVCPF